MVLVLDQYWIWESKMWEGVFLFEFVWFITESQSTIQPGSHHQHTIGLVFSWAVEKTWRYLVKEWSSVSKWSLISLVVLWNSKSFRSTTSKPNYSNGRHRHIIWIIRRNKQVILGDFNFKGVEKLSTLLLLMLLRIFDTNNPILFMLWYAKVYPIFCIKSE